MMEMELTLRDEGFTYIKTSFMVLLEMGHPSIEELQQNYYGIINIVRLEGQAQFIQLLKEEYPNYRFEERIIEYFDEVRILKFFDNQIYFHWFKDRILSSEVGRLVLFEEGHFELVENNGHYLMGIQRYYYAHAVGQVPKRFEVPPEFVESWIEFGIDAVKSFVKNKKSEFWTYKQIWIVELKADMLNKVLNSMNFDGSDFYLLCNFVPADSSEEALTKIDEWLKADYMSLGRIYNAELFDASKKYAFIKYFGDENQSAQMAYQKQVITSLAIPPYSIYSILITPNEKLVSIWLCDEAFWSDYDLKIELCEFFISKEACFNRLKELEIVQQMDFEEFNLLENKDDVPTHYRILQEGNNRFESFQC